MSKTIYLCGAINGCTDAQCRDWREAVKAALADRYTFLDPMRRDYRGREDDCVSEIVSGDLNDIQDSDIVLVAADAPSWGTAMEMHYAFTIGKSILAVCGQASVSPWLRAHSSRMFKTLAEAIAYLGGLS